MRDELKRYTLNWYDMHPHVPKMVDSIRRMLSHVAVGATMRDMRKRNADPVGVLEIAQRLGVRDRTVHMWLYRQIVPEPDYESVNGCRAWEWSTVLEWAGETGHVYADQAKAEYQTRFGKEPAVGKPGPKPKKRAEVSPA